MAKEKFDIYQAVTDRIIAALESGTVPWRKTWAADSHFNPVSKTVYRGINPFLLSLTAMERGYSDPRWMTFKQMTAKGGSFKKLEDDERQKSTMVVFWKIFEDKNDPDKKIPMLRYFNVFNVEQIEGLDLEPLDKEEFEPIGRAKAIIDHMPKAPPIVHGGDRAFYIPKDDKVQLPSPESFDKAESYYATAFHELVHSTGHKSRLNRPEVMDTSRFGSERYAREELVAELGASMLLSKCEIEPNFDNSAAYIASWLKALKDDRKLIISAGGKAQRASDFILDNIEKEA